MNDHIAEATLNDYVDDALPAAERGRVEDHLAACAGCRAELNRLQALLGDIAALPRGIAPSRDLRPAIRERIGRGALRSRLAALGERPLASLRLPLAAAAVLLIAVSSALTVLLSGDREPPQATTLGTAGSAAVAIPPVELATLERRYAAAAEDLLHELEELRDVLAPETLELVQENLRIIDEALRESREALAADPANGELARRIMASHEMKLDLLRRATAASPRS